MRWLLVLVLLVGCKAQRRRMTTHDALCTSGRAFLYVGADDREARRRMTDDGCYDQIVGTVRDDKANGLIGCCPD